MFQDNMYASKVTLSQIVDVYLHLCQNDGVDEPEPLYLTLTTKPTLPAVLSNLEQIAGEGKGISHVQSWESYDEDDVDEAEHGSPVEAVNREAVVSEGQPPEEDPDRPEITEKATVESENEETTELEHDEAKDVDQANESADRAPETVSQSGIDDVDLKHAEVADGGSQTTEEREPDTEGPDHDVEEPAHLLEGDDDDAKVRSLSERAPSNASDAGEASYHTEEQTEVGATLAQSSADAVEDHQDEDVDSAADADLPGDEPNEGQAEEAQDVVDSRDHEYDEQDESQTADADEAQYDEGDDLEDDEWHVEDKTAVDAADAPGESQDDSTTLSHEEDSPHIDDNNDLQLTPEADNALQETLDGVKFTKTTSRTDDGRQDSEPPEDLLGLDDEIFANHEKGNIEESETPPAEFAEDAAQEGGKGVDELGFEDDYVHVDERETGAEVTSPGRKSSQGDVSPSRERGSAKRTRDPEDDLDHPSSPTPNIKRSRSS